MRRACLPMLALALTGCGFEQPPPPAADAAGSAPAVAPAQVDDVCTDIVLTLLDGQLVPLPSADAATFDKARAVTEQFQPRYDQVIASSGVEAARAQYADDIQAACTG